MTNMHHHLLGPNCPHTNTNARHRAILRKSLELFSVEELEAKLGRPTNLRVVMGTGSGFFQLGKITSNFMRDGRVAYRDVYDTFFMKHGDEYCVCDPQARPVMQAAEQTWHEWIVPYLLTRNMGGRPDWALQPLPGLQRVHVAPEPCAPARRAVASSSRATTSSAPQTITLPTPPPSSPVRVHGTSQPGSPTPIRAGARLRPIHISDDDHEARRPPTKRKFLGVIDISDDDEALRPRKKLKFLGFVDLTN
ncbi:hypothetical protein DFH07DRAFT_963019 [Mycena maculata]|uniref:Uncharacterized protein n=1 Tax=Mycena maculata TaxID=230809 RepID=A0AAD7IPP4_9AGAR|nr:hypothetical protein DFH07DRAFT_963019 [Mycena maculata]